MLRTRSIAVLIGIALVGGLIYVYKTPTTFAPMAEFGGVSLRIEIAITQAALERGLGGRASIPDDFGMLFIFPTSDYYGFWMKDTLAPLDIFWLDDKRQVVSMALNVSTTSYPSVFYPPQPALYVLETIAGFAVVHGIATGTPLLLKNF